MRAFARACFVTALGWLAFPSFAAEPTILEVRAAYRWAGLAPPWPGYDYVFTCASTAACTVTGTLWENTISTPKTAFCRQAPEPVASSALRELWLASTLNLSAVKEPVQRLDHTDDYPNFEVTIITSSGSSLLQNASNAFQGGRPWNVKRDGQWFTQKGERIQEAFKKLMQLVPCEKR
jgi:hypothetical protein